MPRASKWTRGVNIGYVLTTEGIRKIRHCHGHERSVLFVHHETAERSSGERTKPIASGHDNDVLSVSPRLSGHNLFMPWCKGDIFRRSRYEEFGSSKSFCVFFVIQVFICTQHWVDWCLLAQRFPLVCLGFFTSRHFILRAGPEIEFTVIILGCHFGY